MNKMFKVVWSAASQTWVAVSELQKAKGKSTKSRTLARPALVALSVGAGTLLGSSAVMAATAVTTPLDGANAIVVDSADVSYTVITNHDKNKFIMGMDVEELKSGLVYAATASDVVVYGSNIKYYDSTNRVVAVGNNVSLDAGGRKVVLGNDITTVGFDKPAIAIGENISFTTPDGLIDAGNNYFNDGQSVAIGYNLVGRSNTVLVGTDSSVTATQAMAIGVNTHAAGQRSIAMGYLANANHMEDVAIGNNAKTTVLSGGNRAVAIGTNARAEGTQSAALGANTSALGCNTVSIGFNSKAEGRTSLTVGQWANSTNQFSMAIGPQSNAHGNNSIAMGHFANTAQNAENSTAIGMNASVATGSINAISIGKNSQSQRRNAISIGSDALVNGENGTAIGNSVRASTVNAIAIGNGTVAGGRGSSTAIGSGAIVNGINAIGIGSRAVAAETNTVVIGNNSQAIVGTTNTAIVGANNNVQTKDTYVLGSNISETTNNSVFLGQGSGKFEQDNSDYNADANGTHKAKGTVTSAYSFGTLQDPTNASKYEKTVQGIDNVIGIVSVGNATATRQLQGVAAGVISATSTDAINGSQLYWVAQQVAETAQYSWTVAENAEYRSDIGSNDVVEFINGEGTVAEVIAGNLAEEFTGELTDGATAFDKDGNLLISSPFFECEIVDEDGLGLSSAEGCQHTGTYYGWVYPEGTDKAGQIYSGIAYKTAPTNSNTTVTFHVNKANATTATNGKIDMPTDGANFVNATVLVDTVNKAGWNTNAVGSNIVTGSNTENTLITAGNRVDFAAGNGVELKREVKDGNVTYTYSTKNSIIQQNGATKVDTFKAGDTVDYVDGKGTTANVSQTTTGYNVTFDVATENGNGTTVYVNDDGKLRVDINPANSTTVNLSTNSAGQLVANVNTGTSSVLANGTATTSAPNNIATVGDIVRTVNNVSWTIAGNGTDKENISAGEKVDFVDGINTVAVVQKTGDSGANVTFNVKDTLTNITSITNTNGSTTNVYTFGNGTTTVKSDGTAAVDANSSTTDVATVGDIVNTINSVSWTVTSGKVADSTGDNIGSSKEQIKAGDTVTFNAGNNILIEQKGSTFNISTTDNVSFGNLSVTGNTSLNNLTVAGNTTLGNLTIRPNSNLDFGNNVITNVRSGANTTTIATTNPDDSDKFLDLANSTDGNVVTVGDLKNYGWIVKTKEDGNSSAVRNADTVTFIGQGVSVTSNGTDITIKANVGDVNGDGSTIDAKNENGTVSVSVKTGDLSNNSNGTVKADSTNGTIATVEDVAKAINGSGWNTTLADGNQTQINPGDVLNYVNGNNTVADVSVNATTGAVEVTYHVEGALSNITQITNVNNGTTNTFTFGNGTTTVSNDGKAEVANGTSKTDVATVGDIVETINNVGWFTNSSTASGNNTDQRISAGQRVDFEVGNGIQLERTVKDGNVTYTYATKATAIQQNGTTVVNEYFAGDVINYVDGENSKANVSIARDANGSAIGYNVTYDVAGDLTNINSITNSNGTTYTFGNGTTTVNTNGTAAVANNSAASDVATVGDIVRTINEVSWTIAGNGTAVEQISAADVVNFNNGQNTVAVVTQNTTTGGADVTYHVEGDLQNISSINNGNTSIALGNGTVNVGGATITNVAPAQNGTDAVNLDQLNNSVAGVTWSITGNNDAANATVVGNSTVSFNDSNSVAAKVDGTNVSFEAQTISLANSSTGSIITPVEEAAQNLTNARTTLNVLPENAPAEVRAAAEKAVADAEKALEAAAYRLVTANDVATAINNSGFMLDVGYDESQGGKAENVVKNDTPVAKVSPGNQVTVKAGRNVEISRTDRDITIATSNDPVFNSVTANTVNADQVTTGGLTVKPNSNIDMGGNRVTNVARGVEDTDAVNVGQLKDEIGGVNNRINKLNKQRKAGHASGIAAASLLQAYREGQSVLTAGAGQYQGQTAVAVGYSRLSDSGKVGIKLSLGTNSQKEVSAGVGVGYFW